MQRFGSDRSKSGHGRRPPKMTFMTRCGSGGCIAAVEAIVDFCARARKRKRSNRDLPPTITIRPRMQIDGVRSGYLRSSLVSVLASVLQGSWESANTHARSHPGNPGLSEEIHMRMLLRVSIPVETGNAAAKAGTLGSTVERILADLKPEAAYFFTDDKRQSVGLHRVRHEGLIANSGCRRAVVSRVRRKVSFRPVMNPQDLATAGPSIAKAGQQYGK